MKTMLISIIECDFFFNTLLFILIFHDKMSKYREKVLKLLIMSQQNEVKEMIYQSMDDNVISSWSL